EAAVIGGRWIGDANGIEAILAQMPLDRGADARNIRTGDEAKLAVGDGPGRNGIDRPARHPGPDGQHVEYVRSVDPLGRRVARLSPPLVDLGALVAAI